MPQLEQYLIFITSSRLEKKYILQEKEIDKRDQDLATFDPRSVISRRLLHRAKLFGSWTSQAALFEEKQQLWNELPVTKIHLRNLHEQTKISDELFSENLCSPWMVGNVAHF